MAEYSLLLTKDVNEGGGVNVVVTGEDGETGLDG